MPIPDEKALLEAACHIGHPRSKWNPYMRPFLFGVRKGIHIFDLTKTKTMLEELCKHLRHLSKEGKTILFVSTKQQSTAPLEALCKILKQPYVTRKWIPGLLTNWQTVKRRLQYYKDLQQAFVTGETEKYTKKEQTHLRKKLAKLDAAFSGVSTMERIPDALFVIDAVRNHVAVAEARKLGIPVFGVCDSNADPRCFTCFVPANDDAVSSIEIILRTTQEELTAPSNA